MVILPAAQEMRYFLFFFKVQLLVSFLTLNIYAVHIQLLYLSRQLFESLRAILINGVHVQPKIFVFATWTAHLESEKGFSSFRSFELYNRIY